MMFLIVARVFKVQTTILVPTFSIQVVSRTPTLLKAISVIYSLIPMSKRAETLGGRVGSETCYVPSDFTHDDKPEQTDNRGYER